MGATKAGFQLLQSYRAERKQDGRDDTAIILSNNSPGYRLDPVQLPEVGSHRFSKFLDLAETLDSRFESLLQLSSLVTENLQIAFRPLSN